jgi:hypothetical protein
VVPRAKIQFSEDHCSIEFVKQILDDRHGKLIF